MPILGTRQPEFLSVDALTRLRRYDGKHDFALEWYRDPQTVFLIDGDTEPYTPQRLKRMYEYLDAHGELYFIERLQDRNFVPIGDVTFWQKDMPIVIGDRAYQGKGIGRRVIQTLIERAKFLQYPCIFVNEIYDTNCASRKCFESAGFRAYEKTEKGSRFKLNLL
ncbi:MAG: GNAT family N-acetyltransferase [Oscillospiraceae bacterium]|nr:GNAT family N-acetyltransferase [Oscillospiraceae bacterium]